MNETPKFQAHFPPLILHRFLNYLEISESVVGGGGGEEEAEGKK